MKKNKKPLSLLLALIMLLGIIAAAPISANAVEAPLIHGTFTLITFDGYDPGELDYYYSDSYFSESGKEQNPHLRTMSAVLEWSVTGKSDTPDETFGAMLSDIGFSDIKTYDMDHTSMDSMGVVLARKKIDGKDVIAVALRGDKYDVEMAANLIADAEGDIKGFSDAEKLVESRVSDYLDEYGITDAKYWVVGYSRSGAVANLFGRELNKDTARFRTTEDDIYVYTIEAPISSGDNTVYENIHNVIDRRDLVTWVYPAGWQLYNNGTAEYIGKTDDTITLKSLDFFSENHINDFGEVKTSDFLKDFTEFAGTNLSRETYSSKLQEPVSKIAEIMFYLDDSQRKNLNTYLKTVLDSMMNDDEFLLTAASALLDPTSAESVDKLTGFLIKHMDKVSTESGKPLDDESYAYVQSKLKQVIEGLLPFANADFFATYDTGDGSWANNKPMYHMMTLAGNFMELIKYHLNYNVFYELAALDSYYIQDDLIGDVNNDGYVAVSDATAIQRYSIELPVEGTFNNLLADVDNDGYITVADATCVQRYVAEFTRKTGNAGKCYKDITPTSDDPQILK